MSATAGGWRPAAGVALVTALSRLLGLLREILFAALLGAGPVTDAFVTAFRIPSAARDLFAEGALSAGLVPAFAEEELRRGRAASRRLLTWAVLAALALSGAVAAALALLAPRVTRLLAPAFSPEVSILSTALARAMLPLLVLVALSAVAMGALQARGRLVLPALSPALFNVGLLAVGLGLWASGATPRQAALGWALGTLLGGALQLGVQLPPLWGARGRRAGIGAADPEPVLSAPPGGGPELRIAAAQVEEAGGHSPLVSGRAAARLPPGLGRMARATIPAAVGLAAVQVNLLVGNAFASRQPGAVSWLGYAFPLIQLPLGVFGLAVASTAGAGLARSAAVSDVEGASRTLAEARRLVAYFGVPAAVGLAVLAEPIASLLYQRGAFTRGDVIATARALSAYALGLYALGAARLLAPAFYAFHGARWPALTSLAAILAHLALAALLQPWLGFQGIALAASLAAILQAALLRLGWRRCGGPPAPSQWAHLARVLLASAVMGGAAWFGWRGLASLWPGPGGLSRQLALALAPVLLGGTVYLVLAHRLGVMEGDALIASARRRFAGSRRRPPKQ